jgi:flagellar basal body-associated protein FliL
MADTKEQQKQTADNDKTPETGHVKISPLVWALMLTIIIVLSGSGFVLGRLMAGSTPEPPKEEEQEETKIKLTDPATLTTPDKEQGTWYYNDLESIIVNPDEPGARRFVRVGLILGMSKQVPQEKAQTLIENKKPLLINWLNLYFKGLSLSEMENERDMNRILSQVRDGFNEILFPDQKPQIEKILIREFNIQ